MVGINPEMIIIARWVRGLSQKELSEQTAIDHGLLSRYENGLRIVSEPHGRIIASVLSFPLGFFLQPGRRIPRHYCPGHYS